MQVRLETREGGHVQDVEILDYQVLPEIVAWGERSFVVSPFRKHVRPEGGEMPIYTEACVAISTTSIPDAGSTCGEEFKPVEAVDGPVYTVGKDVGGGPDVLVISVKGPDSAEVIQNLREELKKCHPGQIVTHVPHVWTIVPPLPGQDIQLSAQGTADPEGGVA